MQRFKVASNSMAVDLIELITPVEFQEWQQAGSRGVKDRKLTNLAPGLTHNLQPVGTWNQFRQLCMEHADPIGTPLKEVSNLYQGGDPAEVTSDQDVSGDFGLDAKQLRRATGICNPCCFRKQLDNFGLRSAQIFDIVLGWNLFGKQFKLMYTTM